MNDASRSAKELKHKQAVERNEKWAALSFEKQLEHLDKIFGKGEGAAKQRAKIAEKIKIRDVAPVKKDTKKSKA